MAQTDKATEAKKLKKELTDQFGDFIDDGVDPISIHKQWVAALFGDEAPDNELLFRALTVAKIANIDIRAGLIYISNGKVIINIDGLVAIADQTGKYGGTSKVEYQLDDKGAVESVRVGIYKVIGEHVLTPEQIVFMSEYDTGEGLWADEGGKKKTMLKKVGLAHAIRASFTICAGLYIPEEMDAKGKVKAGKTKNDMEQDIEKALKKNKKNGTPAIIKAAPKKV